MKCEAIKYRVISPEFAELSAIFTICSEDPINNASLRESEIYRNGNLRVRMM